MTAQSYHNRQILLHWLVVGLVAFQYLTGSYMGTAFDNGTALTAAGGGAWIHGILGTLILLAMLARLVTRRHHGAPPPPETEPGAIQSLSRGVHAAFYVVLIAMPIAGMFAILTGNELAAEAHSWSSTALIVLIVAHVAGAAWHLWKRDGVVSRMMPRG